MAKKKSKAGKPAKRAKQKVSGKKVAKRTRSLLPSPKQLREFAGQLKANSHRDPTGDLIKVRSETEGRTAAEAAAKASDAKMAAEAKLPSFTLVELPVDSIDDPSKGGRVGGPAGTTDADQEALAELSRSIERTGGVLQPIGVHQCAGKRTVIWGSRRLAATKMGDLKKIACKVYKDLLPAQVERLRSIENVQRKEWTLVEESMAVQRAYEKTPVGAGGLTSQKARCAAVGLQMGKSEPWVLDRLYIARLSGEARDLVAKGLLPLQQAREIATIADPGIRDDLAHQAARDDDGAGGMSYEDVSKWTRERRYQLRTVPWKLDVGFAGKPACTNCPSNTANDETLYSHDAEAAKEVADVTAGLCMNRGCFEHKRRSAEASISAAVGKVVAAVKAKTIAKDEVTATSIIEAKIMPATIRESTLVRQAKAAVAPQPRPSASASANGSQGSTKAAPKSKKQIAQEKFDAAHDKWSEGIEKALKAELGKKPGRLMCLVFASDTLVRLRALETLYGGRDQDDRVAKICDSPDIARIFDAIASGDVGAFREYEQDLGENLAHGRHQSKLTGTSCLRDVGFGEWGRPALVALARACGVKVDSEPEPELKMFLEAAGVESKDEKEPAKAGKD